MKEKLCGTQEFRFAGKAEIARCVAHGVDRAHSKIIGSRKRFAQSNGALIIQCYTVGKSSADIDAHGIFHGVVRMVLSPLARKIQRTTKNWERIVSVRGGISMGTRCVLNHERQPAERG